jgi:hypothetical protein
MKKLNTFAIIALCAIIFSCTTSKKTPAITASTSVAPFHKGPPSVRVISPNGGQSYEPGPHVLLWKTKNIPRNANTIVALRDTKTGTQIRPYFYNSNPSVYATIVSANDTETTYAYAYDISAEDTVGSGRKSYKMLVSVWYKTGPDSSSNARMIEDESDSAFVIHSKQSAVVPAAIILHYDSTIQKVDYRTVAECMERWETASGVFCIINFQDRLDRPLSIMFEEKQVGKSREYYEVKLPLANRYKWWYVDGTKKIMQTDGEHFGLIVQNTMTGQASYVVYYPQKKVWNL